MRVKVECAFDCNSLILPIVHCPVHGFTRVRQILETFVETDTSCSFDHHGYCQEHGYFGEPGECHIADGREALGLDKDQS